MKVKSLAELNNQVKDESITLSNAGFNATLQSGTLSGDVVITLPSSTSTLETTNLTSLPTVVHSAVSKTTPADADEIPLLDSAAAFGLKKLTWVNIKTVLNGLFARLVSPAFTGTPTAPTAPAGTNTTQLATTEFAHGLVSKTANGYTKLSNGLIIQWGTVGNRADSYSTTDRITNFPISFPTTCLLVISTHDTSYSNSAAPVYTSNASSWTTSSFTELYTLGRTVWVAIGY